jgi:hypothetical protein
MTPLFLKLNNGTPLMIIPDTEAHLDGHTILTYTYSIITFERPGELFSYTPDGKRVLAHDELEEIIERLTYIRDHPSLWQHMGNL